MPPTPIWRNDYKLGAKTLEGRFRKPGLEWRLLCADAAGVVEWMRMHDHNGWWESARRAGRGSKDLERAWVRHGRQGCEELEASRRKRRLDLPRGPRALARYWERIEPPSVDASS